MTTDPRDDEIKRLKTENERLSKVIELTYRQLALYAENEGRALADFEALRKENDALRAENSRLVKG